MPLSLSTSLPGSRKPRRLQDGKGKEKRGEGGVGSFSGTSDSLLTETLAGLPSCTEQKMRCSGEKENGDIKTLYVGVLCKKKLRKLFSRQYKSEVVTSLFLPNCLEIAH